MRVLVEARARVESGLRRLRDSRLLFVRFHTLKRGTNMLCSLQELRFVIGVKSGVRAAKEGYRGPKSYE